MSTSLDIHNENGEQERNPKKTDEEAIFSGVKMSSTLAKKLAGRLGQCFSANVQNLPMQLDPEPLIQRLKDSHSLQVDMLENFCYRRIFALAPFLSAKQHAQVLQLLTKYDSFQAVHVPTEEEQLETLQQMQKKHSVSPPTCNDSVKDGPQVSEQSIENLRSELLALQKDLYQTKQQYEALEKRAQDLKKANELCQQAAKTSVSSSIQSMMTVLAKKSSELQKCEEKGRDYINHKKRAQEGKVDNTENDPFMAGMSVVVRRKQAKMTLEERYEAEFQQGLPNLVENQMEKEAPHKRLFGAQRTTRRD